uniref:Major facilitator superfamily (MFS) profile domain-containing protein n=1 Tax=Lactuca sativa TaxID=4236 RepID=A0A9R1VQJ1_LACSA|nr:hypothetical protein LSAT_V11C400191180 [Lactuca sativa]
MNVEKLQKMAGSVRTSGKGSVRRFRMRVNLAMISAIASGPIADFFGRKGGPVALDIGRLATGFGMGVFSYVMMNSSVLFAGLLPCVVLLVGLFFVPESPRWLLILRMLIQLSWKIYSFSQLNLNGIRLNKNAADKVYGGHI